MNHQQKDNRVLYLIVTAVVLVGLGIVGFATGMFEPSVSTGSLVANEDFYDFGNIDIMGGEVTKDYKLTNSGTDIVEVNFISTTCMCTHALIEGQSFGMHGPFNASIEFEPGETKILQAVFDPMAHGPNAVGPITREIELRTNSEAQKVLKLKFIGNVVKK